MKNAVLFELTSLPFWQLKIMTSPQKMKKNKLKISW